MRRNNMLALLLILGCAFGVAAAEIEEGATVAQSEENATLTARAATETLSGTITLVNPAEEGIVRVFLSPSTGGSYAFVVNAATRITIRGNAATMADLAGVANRPATITFVAMWRRGNIVKSIDVTR